MNYGGASAIYRKHGWREECTDGYFVKIGEALSRECRAAGIECRSVY